jgi:hypothetical protein
MELMEAAALSLIGAILATIAEGLSAGAENARGPLQKSLRDTTKRC